MPWYLQRLQRAAQPPPQNSEIDCKKNSVISVARSLCDLQVQVHALTVDQHGACIQELLARAVIFLIATHRREREVELDRLRDRGSSFFLRNMNRRAKTDPVELRILLGVVFLRLLFRVILEKVTERWPY